MWLQTVDHLLPPSDALLCVVLSHWASVEYAEVCRRNINVNKIKGMNTCSVRGHSPPDCSPNLSQVGLLPPPAHSDPELKMSWTYATLLALLTGLLVLNCESEEDLHLSRTSFRSSIISCLFSCSFNRNFSHSVLQRRVSRGRVCSCARQHNQSPRWA